MLICGPFFSKNGPVFRKVPPTWQASSGEGGFFAVGKVALPCLGGCCSLFNYYWRLYNKEVDSHLQGCLFLPLGNCVKDNDQTRVESHLCWLVCVFFPGT